MTSIELLLQRQSTPILTTPAPNHHDLEKILAAGMRVPDHACLQPWHFTVVTGDGLQRLSNLLVQSSDGANLTKIAKMPFRAPMIIVVSTEFVQHEKVPNQEQLIAAGCGAHAIQMAAVALGYGAMWRTGNLAYNTKVKQGLDVKNNNEIVGFLYIGTACKEQGLKATKSFENKVSYWK
ncbi:NAD(P)H nitroreductase [Candidatus Colwellia aromaticivorans]|uniref:NAD(P)H nitroreductase n=1 Tax=Candidatus Colwellia aromaticivorans TaxID=2267621 RepID=UPI000DF3AA7E|nr:NAD(P)H nitroreductase [Candidatus Colwellia aromaticivorans]